MANSGPDLASGDVSRKAGARGGSESAAGSGGDPRGRPGPLYSLALGSFALACAAAMWFASQWGIGVSPDSVNYLKSAEKLLAGQGVLSLNPTWPPGYPVLLAGSSLFGSDLLQTTRWLHAALYAANVLLLASLLRPRTRLGRWVAFAGVLFFAASSFEVHFMAWSEAPFVTLQLASALLLARRLAGGSARDLWGSAVLAGLAGMVRFAGFPFVASAGLALVALDRGGLGVRSVRALAYGAIGWGPALAYMLANRWAEAGAQGRQFFFELPGLGEWSPLLPDLLGFFGVQQPWALALLVLAAGLAIAQWWRLGRGSGRLSQREAAFRIALLYLPPYALFLLAYMTFLDGWFRSGRILFPALVFFTVALLVALVGLCERGGRGPRWAAGALMATLVVFSVQAAETRVRDFARDGHGQLERSARALPILDVLRRAQLPIVYANGPDLIYLHVGAASRMLPRHTLPETGLENPTFVAEMRAVAREVERGDAVVVMFTRFAWRDYLPRPVTLEQDYGLEAAYRAPDGVVYSQQGRPLRRPPTRD